MKAMRTVFRALAWAGMFGLIGLSAAGRLTFADGSASGPAAPQKTGVQTRAPEASLELWEKQLVLTPQISSRLSWARKSLAPSGIQKLERMAVAQAPEIASGTGFDALKKQAEADVLAKFPKFGGIAGMDVSEAAFTVMAMATKDMDDDIRMIMAEVKAMTQAKQKLRDQIRQLNEWISQELSKEGQGSSDIEKSQATGGQPKTTKAVSPGKPAPARAVFYEKETSPVLHLEYAKVLPVPPLPPRDSGTTVQGLKTLLDDIKGKLDGMNEMSEMTSLRLQMTMDRRSKFISTLSQMMKKDSTTQDILVQNIK